MWRSDLPAKRAAAGNAIFVAIGPDRMATLTAREEEVGFGGFMGVEPVVEKQELPFPGALLLSSGRSCMALILERERPASVRVPFYTCECLLDPMHERGIAVDHYAVDDTLMPVHLDAPREDELVILIDYFGVRTRAVRELALKLGPRAVIDSTHAYFSGAPPAGRYGFNSARKFRGVPDGGFLFPKEPVAIELPANTEVSGDHLILRMLGSGQSVVQANAINEARISTRIIGASTLTRTLLQHLEHTGAREQRNRNFAAAHSVLGKLNQLVLEDPDMDGPLCYPLLLPDPMDLKKIHSVGIFAARYWPDVLTRSGGEQFAADLSRTRRLIAFPIDQRYSEGTITERAWQLTRTL